MPIIIPTFFRTKKEDFKVEINLDYIMRIFVNAHTHASITWIYTHRLTGISMHAHADKAEDILNEQN